MMRTKRILLVDDDPVSLDVIGTVLQRHGYETAKCHDGVTALEMAMRGNWDLIVLDLGLPSPDPNRVASFDGVRVLEWLRRIKKRIPVLVFTGQTATETEFRAKNAGAYAVVTKDEKLESLLQAVQFGLE